MTRLFCCTLLALYASTINAWTSTSSMISAFNGRLVLERTSAASNTVLCMKKNRSVPPHMRSQYARMQEMQTQRDQMMANSKPGADGLPVFNLYVRANGKGMWYPCGSFKGDERSAALAKSYSDGGLMSGLSKNQLDAGISGSLFRDKDKLIESLVRALPQLRQSRDNLEFGYKLAFEGLDEDKAKIEPIEVKEQKGIFDNIKNAFNFGGGEK
ncbi:hypothetical protein MPSEU_000015300 [Mayamaea pseudoterrestris]|nr:hypothetical protein MPSEU_000015300 [Mayamaea pseudoterrestris]